MLHALFRDDVIRTIVKYSTIYLQYSAKTPPDTITVHQLMDWCSPLFIKLQSSLVVRTLRLSIVHYGQAMGSVPDSNTTC